MTWSEILAAVSALMFAALYLTERRRVVHWHDRYHHDTGSAEGALQELEAMLRAYGIDPDAPMPPEVKARYLAEIATMPPPQMGTSNRAGYFAVIPACCLGKHAPNGAPA